MIAASTVLIKQHYLVDIPAGVLLAFACYGIMRLRFPLLQQAFKLQHADDARR